MFQSKSWRDDMRMSDDSSNIQFLFQTQMNVSLYTLYYAKACNRVGGAYLRVIAPG